MQQRIRLFMARKRLTQQKIAEQLGISGPYVSDILSGKRKAPAMRRRLALELGFPPRLVGLYADLSPRLKYSVRRETKPLCVAQQADL